MIVIYDFDDCTYPTTYVYAVQTLQLVYGAVQTMYGAVQTLQLMYGAA